MDGTPENQLHLSWSDSAWLPILNQQNVLDYFCQRSNPFYDRTCNNEIIKMQKQESSQLQNMKGMEYVLLHVMEPVLYVIRKNYRQGPDKLSPVADYYILAGTVYQCPDLKSVLNSRLLSSLHLVDSAFDEVFSYARYHPTKGHYWEFPTDMQSGASKLTATQSLVQEPSDSQCKRVEKLFLKLVEKYPYKALASKDGGKPVSADSADQAEKSTGVQQQGTKRQPPSSTEGDSEAKRKKT